MAVFDYRAITGGGKQVKGMLDASSLESARERLRSRGLFIQSLTEMKKSGSGGLGRSFSFRRKSTVTTQITRQLGFLLSAHIPVVSALDGVIDQAEDEKIKKMMIDIKEKMKEGKSVSQAFSDYPDYFNNMYVNTLKAGEASGRLESVFKRLSEMYERNQALVSKLRSTLTYPAVLLLFSVVVIVFLVSFIVPTFAKLFEDFGQALPLPTRVLIGLSQAFSAGWWIILIVLVFLFFMGRRIYRGERGRVYLDGLVFKIPVVKNLVLDTFRIRFSFTMSLMLGNGVGIIESLQNTGHVFRNRLFTNAIADAITKVKKGAKLSKALSSNEVFNASLLGMIHAGEMSDRVSEVLQTIGDNLEIDLEERIGILTSLVEPVMLLVIGIIVGFAVLSIMLPIFQINQIFG